MKQHITPEQLEELTYEQTKTLWEWWKPNSGDKYYYPKVDSTGYIHSSLVYELEHFKDGDYYPLLSIGQMIEFLYENANDFGVHYNDSGVFFKVYLSWMWDTASIDRRWTRDELCDALWEAIKAVL